MEICLGVLGRLFRIGRKHGEPSNNTSTEQVSAVVASCSDVLERCRRDKYCIAALFIYHLCGRVISLGCYRRATKELYKLRPIYDHEEIGKGWLPKAIAQAFIKALVLNHYDNYAVITEYYMNIINQILKICNTDEITEFIKSNMMEDP